MNKAVFLVTSMIVCCSMAFGVTVKEIVDAQANRVNKLRQAEITCSVESFWIEGTPDDPYDPGVWTPRIESVGHCFNYVVTMVFLSPEQLWMDLNYQCIGEDERHLTFSVSNGRARTLHWGGRDMYNNLLSEREGVGLSTHPMFHSFYMSFGWRVFTMDRSLSQLLEHFSMSFVSGDDPNLVYIEGDSDYKLPSDVEIPEGYAPPVDHMRIAVDPGADYMPVYLSWKRSTNPSISEYKASGAIKCGNTFIPKRWTVLHTLPSGAGASLDVCEALSAGTNTAITPDNIEITVPPSTVYANEITREKTYINANGDVEKVESDIQTSAEMLAEVKQRQEAIKEVYQRSKTSSTILLAVGCVILALAVVVVIRNRVS